MRILTVLVLSSISLVGVALGDDWPQFLGPARNGISNEKKLTSTFPEEGPDVLWRTPLGTGMSGVAISNQTAFTLYQTESDQLVAAFDAETGKLKWETKVSAAFENSMGNGPRATPTVWNGTIYAFTGDGVLCALQESDGKLLWSVNAVKELSGRLADYGMSSSPLLTKTGVVVQVGSPNGTVASFDRKTGQKQWSAGNDAAGYSSPILTTLAGKEQIVAFVGAQVMGIAPENGSVLWKFRYVTDFKCNTATPVVVGDSTILISSGENHGSTVLTVTADDEEFNVKEGWSSLGNDSVLRAEWQTPVLLDGNLYGLDNKGSAGPITNLVCVRASDGEQLWIKPRFGKSNLTLADGKLFIASFRGELIIVAATPDGFTETARAVVTENTRQAPVIANGRLYMRDNKELVCINISAK